MSFVSLLEFVVMCLLADSISTEPPARQGGGKVDNVDGLVSKLKELGAL